MISLPRAKRFVHRSFDLLGYQLHRKRPSFEPYVETFVVAGVTFPFWIADETTKAWYTPEGHARTIEHREEARLIAPGDRVLDIGAHHGFTTVFFSKLVGPAGFVLAVEPLPSNAIIVAAQLGLNRSSNTEILQAVVSDHPGTAKISRESNAAVGQSEGMLEVQALTVDNLDATYGPFQAVKIDVEGFEYQVLRGAQRLLHRGANVILELHPDRIPAYGSSLAATLELLAGYQGTCMPRVGHWEQAFAFPEKPAPTDVPSNLFLSRV